MLRSRIVGYKRCEPLIVEPFVCEYN